MGRKPRLRILADDELTGPARSVVERWNLNLHRILANSPDMLADWLPFAERVLRGNSMDERQREIVILRVAVSWGSAYEWAMHGRLARRIGMSEDDLHAAVAGPASPHWTPHEANLLRATDSVLARRQIDDALWDQLAAELTSQQLVDFLMTIAEFSLVAIMLTNLRIPLEDQPDLPRLADYLPPGSPIVPVP